MTELHTLSRALTDAFIDQYPQEATEVLEAAPVSEIVRLLQSQPPPKGAQILGRISTALATAVLQQLGPGMVRQVVGAMDPVRAALLLGSLDEQSRDSRLGDLDTGLARELRDLMSYPEGSAGRLMQPRAASLPARLSVKQALNRLRRFPPHDTAILVVADDAGKLLGLVDLADLVRADPGARLETLLPSVPPVRANALTPREEIIDLFSRYRLRLLPVVDLEDRLLGVIYQSTVIQAAQEEAATDIQAMVGVSRDERALSSPLFAMRKRLPWLNINLLTAFLAAAVVGLFENTIAQFTALAVLLPVVAGQSGNTGAQALAVIMRGLALREIRVRQWQRVLIKELLAGILNGVTIAIVTGLGVLVWSHSAGLALVIGAAMILSMALAGLAGAAIPLILTRLGQDPAQSASIILTTVTDVVGFFSFLGLATLFSSLL
ncbi:MAG TPA: magnesium transporter [Gammaproteobacteria bacterium]|nr:magnesium transporter [Gammaproteobacteria bacterium]